MPTVPGTFWILLFFQNKRFFFQKVPLAHRLQVIQNWRKFPRKVWNDVAWIPKFLMVFNFFFKILFPSICSSSMYTGVLTTLPNSCRQRPEMFRSNLKTNWSYKIFFRTFISPPSDPLALRTEVWELGNLAHKDSRNLKKSLKKQKGPKNLVNFREMFILEKYLGRASADLTTVPRKFSKKAKDFHPKFQSGRTLLIFWNN